MQKLLIANRGEIAIRIIRAARDYGIKSVAIYADCDSAALFVQQADEAYALKGNAPQETYLNMDKIIAIAKKCKADAIHPGYGFLSENAEFAKKTLDAGLIWIGPSPEIIDILGDKVKARIVAKKAGAPLVAGSEGMVESAKEIADFAKQHGFPIAIKAAYGGGGRGMKVVWKNEDVAESFDSAVHEAKNAFGRGECFVEQFLNKPRHVEAQVIADTLGNVVVVGTRDCSMQRRNQKLIEEAPAPFLTDKQRESIHKASENIFKEAGYVGVGTVEFLLSAAGIISFLEVNTRLQVEHPITEQTANIDLVIEQLRIADGLELSIKATPEPIGHAFEFRINAEDVGRGFLPCPGTILRFDAPSGAGVRLDSGVVAGNTIAPMFDSMMAKLIIYGKDREEALKRARRALAEMKIEGVATVLPFHQLAIEHSDFTAKDGFKVHTRWIETDFAEKLAIHARGTVKPTGVQRFKIEIDGKLVELGLPIEFLQSLGGISVAQSYNQEERKILYNKGDVIASIAGTIRAWQVENGAIVEEGQTIALMEAMKMETAIVAPIKGKIEIIAKVATMQQSGEVIARIAVV